MEERCRTCLHYYKVGETHVCPVSFAEYTCPSCSALRRERYALKADHEWQEERERNNAMAHESELPALRASHAALEAQLCRARRALQQVRLVNGTWCGAEQGYFLASPNEDEKQPCGKCVLCITKAALSSTAQCSHAALCAPSAPPAPQVVEK